MKTILPHTLMVTNWCELHNENDILSLTIKAPIHGALGTVQYKSRKWNMHICTIEIRHTCKHSYMLPFRCKCSFNIHIDTEGGRNSNIFSAAGRIWTHYLAVRQSVLSRSLCCLVFSMILIWMQLMNKLTLMLMLFLFLMYIQFVYAPPLFHLTFEWYITILWFTVELNT